MLNETHAIQSIDIYNYVFRELSECQLHVCMPTNWPSSLVSRCTTTQNQTSARNSSTYNQQHDNIEASEVYLKDYNIEAHLKDYNSEAYLKDYNIEDYVKDFCDQTDIERLYTDICRQGTWVELH